MAIGSEDAQFCLSEVRIGLAPAVISPFVVKAIGERATRRYALTAERFSGVRAQQLGLLAEAYPAEQLDQQVEAWVDNLLLNSPQALRASKDLLREVGHGELTPAVRRYCETALPASASAPRARRACAPSSTSAAPPGNPPTRTHAHEPPHPDYLAGCQPRRNRMSGDAHR